MNLPALLLVVAAVAGPILGPEQQLDAPTWGHGHPTPGTEAIAVGKRTRLVVFGDNTSRSRERKFVLLGLDGQVRAPGVVVHPEQLLPLAAFNGVDYLVAWLTYAGEFQLGRISEDGVQIPAVGPPFPEHPARTIAMSLVAGAETAALLYSSSASLESRRLGPFRRRSSGWTGVSARRGCSALSSFSPHVREEPAAKVCA